MNYTKEAQTRLEELHKQLNPQDDRSQGRRLQVVEFSGLAIGDEVVVMMRSGIIRAPYQTTVKGFFIVYDLYDIHVEVDLGHGYRELFEGVIPISIFKQKWGERELPRL